MKNALLFASVAALLAAMVAFGQEKSADRASCLLVFRRNIMHTLPNDIKVLGMLDNGQTSKPAEYFSTPKYRAFVFEGNGHDQVEITVTRSKSKGLCCFGRFGSDADCERPGAACGDAALSRPGYRSVLHLGEEPRQPAGAPDGSSEEDGRFAAQTSPTR